jgi:hypothetical protein
MMRMINRCLQIAVVCFMVLMIGSCNKNKTFENNLQLECFETGDGWGYAIKHKEKQIIYQPIIPAISQRSAFPTKHAAETAGKLVLKKMIRREMPTLSIAELVKAGIIKVTNEQEIIIIQ